MMKIIYMLAILGLFTFTACDDDNDGNGDPISNCDYTLSVIDADNYDDYPSSYIELNSVSLQGDCLEITVSAGGCDGSTWEHDLLFNDMYALSDPPQAHLFFSLKNEEVCNAIVTKTYSYDISYLNTTNELVVIYLHNYAEQITYPEEG